MAILNVTGSDNIDWLCPVNWQHPQNRGLVAWYLALQNQPGWKSDTWMDLTDPVYGIHGTLTNMEPATDWVAQTHPGGFGSLDFDGSDDYVEAGDGDSFDLPSGVSRYMFAWINTNSTSAGFAAVAVQRNSGTSSVWGLWRNGNDLYAEVRSNSRTDDVTGTVQTNMVAGEWLLVGLRRTASGSVDIYRSKTGASAGAPGWVNIGSGHVDPITDADEGLQIGRHSTSAVQDWNGKMASVFMFQGTEVDADALYQESILGYPNLLNRVPRRTYFVPAAPSGTTATSRLTLLGVS